MNEEPNLFVEYVRGEYADDLDWIADYGIRADGSCPDFDECDTLYEEYGDDIFDLFETPLLDAHNALHDNKNWYGPGDVERWLVWNGINRAASLLLDEREEEKG